MATLNEYYLQDFPTMVSNHIEWEMNATNGAKTTVKLHYDFDSNSTFISYYIPYIPELNGNEIDVFTQLVDHYNTALKTFESVQIHSGLPGEDMLVSSDLRFSGRIFIYYEGKLSDQHRFRIFREELKEKNLFIHCRDMNYSEGRSATEKPLAFISHDSRDKELIASKLAEELTKRMCPVWYDEYSLKMGDSLRESIEKGLKECKKCVLILSPNFLSNLGWTKTEFNTIFTREIIETQNLVLPIWAGVEKKDIYEYSPILVDRVGVNWDKGLDFVVNKIQRAVFDS